MNRTSSTVWSEVQVLKLLTPICSQSGCSKLLADLVTREILQREQFSLRDRPVRYLYGTPTPLAVAASLAPQGYFTHTSALFLNGLAPGWGETLWINTEQRGDGKTGKPLTQSAIDAAFGRPARQSANRARYQNTEICLWNGKKTGDLGVTGADHPRHGPIRYTNLARTLVDCARRPSLAGGPVAVLQAFAIARSEIDINTLAEMLEALDDVYPYHQAVGFYLHRSGFPIDRLPPSLRKAARFDFYLDNQLISPRRCPHWRVYYPPEMD
jgi:hypothetical protein